MTAVNFYLPIAKVDREQRMVFGYASTPTRDIQGEVIELDAIKDALPDYMAWRNIREMHGPSAVGVTKEANVDDKGLYIGAKIVDDDAWKKVVEEVYKGFSIGGDVTRRDGATITGLDLIEISLVDRPANPDCRIDVVKAARGATAISDRTEAMAERDSGEVGWLRRMVEKLARRDTASVEDARRSAAPIEKADKQPYGDVEYADPGYQKDGKKRYPIDTEEHIRAAWNYIHKEKNGDEYTAEQLASIKRRIVAAWKKKIGEDGPPEAHEDKAAAEGEDIPAGRDGFSRPAKAAEADGLDAGDGAGKFGAAKMAEAEIAKRAATGRHEDNLRRAAHHIAAAAKAFDRDEREDDGGDAEKAAVAKRDAHERGMEHLALAAHFVREGAGVGDGWPTGGRIRETSQREMTEGSVDDYSVERPYPGKAAHGETISKGEHEALLKAARLEGELEALRKQPQSPKARLFAVPRGSLPVTEAEEPSAMEKLFKGVNIEATNPAERQNAAARMIGNMVANSATFARPVLTDPSFRGGAGR